jgi:hypothetical protein
MTNCGVFYLLTGPAHGVRLVVSLWSLRRHYAGPVTVFTTHTESHEIGDRCRRDPRLRVDHCPTRLADVRRNAAFLTKLDVLGQVPYPAAVYLDADTLIVGRLDPLIEAANRSEFAATQFADWLSSGRLIRRRIEAWRSVQPRCHDSDWMNSLVDEALQPRPAVNGGVFAFQQGARLLPQWRELAYAGWNTFICDEIALQLLLPRYPHEVLDCRFNCSPLYGFERTDVRVWHFHGERHLRHARCRELWWPAYRICVAENIAGLAEWQPGADRRLRRFLSASKRTL